MTAPTPDFTDGEYLARAMAVYWDRVPACRRAGPVHARCLLEKEHEDDHKGNGYDEGGPLPRRWR